MTKAPAKSVSSLDQLTMLGILSKESKNIDSQQTLKSQNKKETELLITDTNRYKSSYNRLKRNTSRKQELFVAPSQNNIELLQKQLSHQS